MLFFNDCYSQGRLQYCLSDGITKKNESTAGGQKETTFPHITSISTHVSFWLTWLQCLQIQSAVSELLVCSRVGQGSLSHVQQHRSRLTVRWKMQMSVSAAAHLDFAFSSSPVESNATLADSGYTVTITLEVTIMRVYSARYFQKITVNVWVM